MRGLQDSGVCRGSSPRSRVLQRVWPPPAKASPAWRQTPGPCQGCHGAAGGRLHAAKPRTTPPVPELSTCRHCAQPHAVHGAAVGLTALWGTPGPAGSAVPQPTAPGAAGAGGKAAGEAAAKARCSRPEVLGAQPAGTLPPALRPRPGHGAAARLLEGEAAGKAARAAGKPRGGEARRREPAELGCPCSQVQGQ